MQEMLPKFDTTPYCNPHSLVKHTRWVKLSFLGKKSSWKRKNSLKITLLLSKRISIRFKVAHPTLAFKILQILLARLLRGNLLYLATHNTILLNHNTMPSFLHARSYYLQGVIKKVIWINFKTNPPAITNDHSFCTHSTTFRTFTIKALIKLCRKLTMPYRNVINS